MKEEYNLSIKVVDKHSLARNDDKTLDARVEWVKKWIDEGVEYLDNCVSVDESGFDINMRRSRGVLVCTWWKSSYHNSIN